MPNTNKGTRSFEFFTDLKKQHDLLDFSKPIMVSCESIAPFTENNIMSDDGLTWYIDLMYFDMWSRNQNMYPREDTVRSFNESYWIQENLRNRTLYGELEHPPADAELDRFMFIEPTRYAWNILSIEDKGDKYAGMVGLCAPLGTSIVLPNIKRFGCNYAASCRISTPNFVVKEMNGRKAYIKKYKQFPITFDLVTTPGIPTCRLIKDGQYQPEPVSLKSNNISKESGSPFVAVFSDPAATIKEMLKSEESGRIVSDIFGIDFDKSSLIVTKDKKVKISTESGASATLPMNSFILSDILRNSK
mgnify:CR=1 FL=1